MCYPNINLWCLFGHLTLESYAILRYMSNMLPKKLTEMQIKFAQLLVTNEGRKTPTECAIEAGYVKDRATITASELENFHWLFNTLVRSEMNTTRSMK